MIVSVLRTFIDRCDRLSVTPDEGHIHVFLENMDCLEYKNAFIKFCHFSWEDRNLIEDLEELLFTSLIEFQPENKSPQKN